jgi:hypothetical protein
MSDTPKGVSTSRMLLSKMMLEEDLSWLMGGCKHPGATKRADGSQFLCTCGVRMAHKKATHWTTRACDEEVATSKLTGRVVTCQRHTAHTRKGYVLGDLQVAVTTLCQVWLGVCTCNRLSIYLTTLCQCQGVVGRLLAGLLVGWTHLCRQLPKPQQQHPRRCEPEGTDIKYKKCGLHMFFQQLLLTCAGPQPPTPAAAGHRQLPDPQTEPYHWQPLSSCACPATQRKRKLKATADCAPQIIATRHSSSSAAFADTCQSLCQGCQWLMIVCCPRSVLRSRRSAAPVCGSSLAVALHTLQRQRVWFDTTSLNLHASMRQRTGA